MHHVPPWLGQLLDAVKTGGRWLWEHPIVLIIAVTFLILLKVILYGRLVYGDIPLFQIGNSEVNAFHAWGSEQLGTSVRQSLNTLRDVIISAVSFHDEMYYFIKYVLPIILIPVTYFFILKKLGIKHKGALVLGALFPLFTPIVFGDFLTGQTFWIYLTVPWVFYYAIRSYCFKEFSYKHNLLLALWLFLSLGMLPPIIVPLIGAVVGLVLVMLIADIFEKKYYIRSYLLSGFVVSGIFLLLASPYLLVASSGQAAFTPPSLLGDYYHNYAQSGLAHTLRLAGNNGNGQATLDYNTVSISNIAGYALLAGIVFGAFVIGVQYAGRRYRTMMVGLFAIALPILGFMNLLNTNTIFGIKVFESQWIVGTVRSPSKLYNLLLPVFVIFFAFAFEQLMRRSGSKWQKVTVVGASVLLLGMYGWPALRGDLGLLYNREDKLGNYKPDPAVTDAIKHMPSTKTRSLLMPADHRDELNYQYQAPGFNLLRLEGGIPSTAKLMDNVNESLNTRNRYFFNYLKTTGVENVVVQKDPLAYEDALFGLFPVDWTPEETRDFMATGLQPTLETPNFWQFNNPEPAPLVYSPQQLIQIKSNANLDTKAPFLSNTNAVVDQEVPGFEQAVSMYDVQKLPQNGETISGKAQLHDPQLITIDVYSRGARLLIDVIHPISGEISQTLTQAIPEDASVAMIGTERFMFSDVKKRMSVYAGGYDVMLGSLQEMPLNADPSFEEKTPPKVFDATPRQSSNARIYTRLNKDVTHGRQSVLLGSGGHTAFITRDVPVDDAGGQYILSFDYKNIKGNAASFGIMNGQNNVLKSGNQLKQATTWQNQQAFIEPHGQGNAILKAYFYTAAHQAGTSENLIDNLRLYKIHQLSMSPMNLPAYEPDYDLANYRYTDQPEQRSGNLLNNSSFEDRSLWGRVGDASRNATGEARMSASQSSDAVEGRHALKLESNNHTAYMAQSVSSFEKNSVYKLSFKYKNLSGRKPAFAIWQDGAKVAVPAQQFKDGKDWTYYETAFVPHRNATNLTLYLYSYSNGEKTINLFDDVVLERTSPIATYLRKMVEPKERLMPIVNSFTRLDPTHFILNMKPGKGMVILNESYHQGWQAYIVPGNGYKPGLLQSTMLRPPGELIKDHLIVNGFANGWLLDSNKYPALKNEDYTIILQYEPQKFLYGGFIVSTLTLTTAGGVLLYSERLRRRRL